ncbi:hypothetical protein MMPV_002690 [Pyropia vietnamensis]
MIAVGTWAVVAQSGSAYNRLTFGASVSVASLYLSMSAICAGVIMVLLPLVGCAASRRGTCRAGLTLGYMLVLAILWAVAIFTGVVMLQVGTGGVGRSATRDLFSDAWTRSVQQSPVTVCGVEAELNCRGLDDGDCQGCPDDGPGDSRESCDLTRCAACEAAGAGRKGCYPSLYGELASKARPVGIIAVITAVVVGLDFIAFTLVRMTSR